MTQPSLLCGRYRLPLNVPGGRPLVMGILNVTPDSFSDGGAYYSLESALSRAEQMIADGVDIIDIGGESSRPGTPPVPLEEELRRVMPLLYALRDCGKPLSIDTYKWQVMREAIAAGVDMINDIQGFRVHETLQTVKDSDCALCIMHMQGEPLTMQVKPNYADVVSEVTGFLAERVRAIEKSGIARDRLCIDPGFGFGKTLDHNLDLLKNIGQLRSNVGLPVLAGLSRKSMIGAITGKPIEHRLAGSLAAVIAAVERGAQLVRVHDVAETVGALEVWDACNKS